MQDFRDVIDECGFRDLGYMGSKFTWAKHYSDGTIIWERLDRALGTEDWVSLFPAFQMVHLECGMSDHKLVHIYPMGVLTRRQWPWHFEWSKQSFCNISRALIEKRSSLKSAEEATQLGGDYNPVYTIKKEISKLLLLEEQLWHQRSPAHWMKSSDKNTAFFHSKVSQRLRRNRIVSLRNNGVLCTGEAKVTGLLVSYFKQLFTSSQPTYFETVLQEVPRVVTAKMNSALIGKFTRAKVDMALKQMAPLKAPGPYEKYDLTYIILILPSSSKSKVLIRAQLGDVQTIQALLGVYEKELGQQINKEKTNLFFSKSVSNGDKIAIKNLLGVAEIKEYEKYLGLPAVVGKNRRASLNYIKERVWGKLQGWKEKILSQAGKDILLKAMIQAIPTFAMSCFKLLVGLCKDIEVMIRKFCGGNGMIVGTYIGKIGKHCAKPRRILGFKDLSKFNAAMLAK
ncbi:uncharacterized protein LOC126727832 [Quercus robur]|uniref:uncharacterized protein LOC126727832 n=1 Tax=Quercus robur TaxID=38942 RepID=UPI0021629C59|nr:uncharacterized protein LOC126727832 [Quercus robur]